MRPLSSAQRPTLPLLAIAALAFAASNARAIVVFDNFDPNGGFHPAFYSVAARSPCASESGIRAAARFTVSGNDLQLTSITLAVGCERFQTEEHKLRVRIASDDAGRPGATIEVLSENEDLWPPDPNPTTRTLTSTTHPLLESGTSYWIVTEPSSVLPDCSGRLTYSWHDNTSGTTVPFVQDVETGVPVDPWINLPQPGRAAFRVEGEETVDVDDGVESPALALGSVGPMPFSESTLLELSLPVAGPVSLVIYDVTGHRVRTLVSGTLGAGHATRTWNGRNEAGDAVPSGLYFAHLKSRGFEKTHKLLLAR